MPDIMEVRTQDVPCYDPECDGIAESEQDGDHLYYTCQTCGFEFGHERITTPSTEGSCSAGIPENLRRLAESIGTPDQKPVPTMSPVKLTRKPS